MSDYSSDPYTPTVDRLVIDWEYLGEQVRRALDRRGLSLEEAAALSGLSVKVWRRAAHGLHITADSLAGVFHTCRFTDLGRFTTVEQVPDPLYEEPAQQPAPDITEQAQDRMTELFSNYRRK